VCSLPAARACPDEEEVTVTMVSIVATEKNNKIDPKLKELAERIKAKKPNLTGFRIDTQCCESIPVGKAMEVKMVDNQKATVTVRQAADEKNQVRLTVKAPCVGEIRYTTCCGKFFPIVTCYKCKDGDCLIVAVMVKPCKGK
jgi:hypothetical protein